MKRVLGIDFGEKRIGLAISDDQGRLALGRETLERISDSGACEVLKNMADEDNVDTIVLGLPKSLQGKDEERAQRTKRFGKKLEEKQLNVVYEDERLTSVLADRLMTSGDRDQKSAILILQSYLDRNQ